MGGLWKGRSEERLDRGSLVVFQAEALNTQWGRPGGSPSFMQKVKNNRKKWARPPGGTALVNSWFGGGYCSSQRALGKQ